MLLKDKVAIVTGASRGIGWAIARRFAEEGASIMLCARNPENARSIVKELSHPVDLITCSVDVSKPEQVQEMVQKTLDKWGKIHILINNAGITRDGLLVRMSLQDWQEVIDVNLTGAFLCSKAVSKSMIQQRSGAILNITSIIGLTGNAGQSNYAASKAGMIGLTKSLARELASRSIRVNAVAPGFIETEMTSGMDQKAKEAALGQIPLGYFGKAENVAEAALFLVSDQAGYITGQVLQVDGGMVI